MKRKYLYSFNKPTNVKCLQVLVGERGWVNGKIPLEDFGDFILLDKETPIDEVRLMYYKALEAQDKKI